LCGRPGRNLGCCEVLETCAEHPLLAKGIPQPTAAFAVELVGERVQDSPLTASAPMK
jgi:hypothetical protein